MYTIEPEADWSELLRDLRVSSFRELAELSEEDYERHKADFVQRQTEAFLQRCRARLQRPPRIHSPSPKQPQPKRAKQPAQEPTSISYRLRYLVLKRDKYRCQLCGKSASDGIELEVDHKLARAKGGKNTLDNLWALCFYCNRGKSDLGL